MREPFKTISIALATVLISLLLFACPRAKATDQDICPYRYLVLTPEEERLLAQCLEAECSSAEYCGYGDHDTGIRCKTATCQVILNRLLNEDVWHGSNRLNRIICTHSQFSTYPSFLGVEPTAETYEVMYNTLMGYDLQLDYDVCFFSLSLVPGTEYVCTIGRHVFSR